ncbi:mannan endo-1,4-beta-mannosidase 2-like isoform X2 [Durio zibethinus]|uniref:mannan endo-1,4-beta-mannosidase n=1 Tax=Durio zibethinus TaxID=66656 RepID=A0A6P5YDH4_DURZI|nr:mannan endo-1,4-beta-mannosidase 2-like isoform X2 [Durio zibethinus]
MVNGNRMLYPILGFASCVAFIYMSLGDLKLSSFPREPRLSFVERNGTQFFLDGKPLYVNGWNSYWLMAHSVDENSRPRVSAMLQAGAKMGLTVCRTWAFNDGGYDALQISPGQFDERVFKALDYVIAEARQHGIRLLLSLVNNLQAYGGKTQYVKWAWQEGVGLSSSNDSFFFDPSIRKYFKNYVLDWLEEMTAFIKSIDKNHLLTVGLEGFYGPKSPKKSTVNPEVWASTLGSDFIRNSNISNVDFTSVHIYPDHWFHVLGFEEKQNYVYKWVRSHIEDCDKELKKPVMFTEYGLSNQNKDFQASQREQFYRSILDIIYKSARKKGSGAGALIWQFFVEGMEDYNDDFGLVPWESPSIYKLTVEQSCRLARIQGLIQENENLKVMCSKTE